MTTEESSYLKKEIDKSGEILKNQDSTEEQSNKAIDILDEWRTIHRYPLHVFQMTLKNKAQREDRNALISQRLKRTSSIIKKLNRHYDNKEPSLRLSQIQDIAGCRAILKDIPSATKLFKKYVEERNFKHKFIKSNDYVLYPKKDGYRSFHVVYEYKSDKGKKEYNGLKVEVQIRTRLQHAWATAVETVDFFTRQSLKLSEGNPQWEEFFRLVSSAFAIEENCPIVTNTPTNRKQLYNEIKEKQKELNVIDKLTNWANALRHIDEKKLNDKKAKFFLLELDILREDLSIQTYTEKQEERATKEYSLLEKKYKNQKDYDVVLVGVDKAKDLKKAYPNYFIDTTDFVQELKIILSKTTV